MATQNLCPEMKRSSSCSSNSSQLRRDEHTTSGVMTEATVEEATANLEQTGSNNFNLKQGEMQTFKKQEDQPDEVRDDIPKTFKTPPYVPVYQQNLERTSSPYDKLKASGIGSQRPGGGIVYAELQLPRSSNNGSMRRGGNRHPHQKTQYAEITFQGRPLQTADI